KKDLGGAMPPRPTMEMCHNNKITFFIYTKAWDRVWGKEAAAQATAAAKEAVRKAAIASAYATTTTGPATNLADQKDLAERRQRYREYLEFYARLKLNFPNAHPDPPKDDGTDKTAYELRSRAYQAVYGRKAASTTTAPSS